MLRCKWNFYTIIAGLSLFVSTAFAEFTPVDLVTQHFPWWSVELKTPIFPIPNNLLFLNPAFYFGYQAGYADNQWTTMSPLNIPDDASQVVTRDTGYAYNVYMGYNYNYFSIEGGYIGLPTSTFLITQDGVQSQAEVDEYALDFLLKGTVPIGRYLGIYAKAGAGYISSTPKGGFFNTNGAAPLSQSHIGPAFGLGINLAITCNLIADVNWLRLSGQGQAFNGDFNYIPQTDIFLGGFVYKIPVDYF